MLKSRTMGYLLGISAMLGSAGNAAWAADYSGTLDFSTYGPIAVNVASAGDFTAGIDLDRYNLGSDLGGVPLDVKFTTKNAYNGFTTMPGLIFATDPNEAIFSNPTSLAGLMNPLVDANAFLDANVTGWQYYAYGNVLAVNGTTDLAAVLGSTMTFTPGVTYYAFIAGGSLYDDSRCSRIRYSATPSPSAPCLNPSPGR